MSNRIKSVNLCDETEPIADHIMANGGNFSRFVRECLIRYYAETKAGAFCPRKFDGEEEPPLCNPHQDRRCVTCWPAGKPTVDDWRNYRYNGPKTTTHQRSYTQEGEWEVGDKYTREFPGSEHFNDHVWIYERALEVNPPLFDMKDLKIKGNAKSSNRPRRRRRSLIRRLLRVA